MRHIAANKFFGKITGGSLKPEILTKRPIPK